MTATENKKIFMPWYLKHCLTIEQASEYFNIGEKTLRRFIHANKDEDCLISVGNKVLIKRKAFEDYLDQNISAL